MCAVLFGDLENSAGAVYHLTCPTTAERTAHFLELATRDTTTTDDSTVLTRVVESLAVRASIVVIEGEYFDVDYRSEFSRTFATAFDARYFGLSRLHFFQVPDAKVPETRYLRDFVHALALLIDDERENGPNAGTVPPATTSDFQVEYLGYFIWRPQLTGTVGRSVLAPIADIPSIARNVPSGRLIRTIASEPISLFGIQFLAIGIPFMEQDGHLLRCAHVSIWICHYSSWMRGLTTRRTTGYIHAKASDAEPGRTYPSSGLSLEAIKTVLDDVGLPPEEAETFGLSRPRPFTWADRTDFISEIKQLEEVYEEASAHLKELEGHGNGGIRGEQLLAARAFDDAAAKLNERWTRENLTAMICRYLNSSTPSILVRMGSRHTQVVVGYVRNEDHNTPPAGHPSDVTTFIVSDDLGGPFDTEDIETLAQEVVARETSIVTPLPKSLWLTGDFAERSAIAWFAEYADDLKFSSSIECDEAQVSLSEDFNKFHDSVCGGVRDQYAIRSYWIKSGDFKIDIADDTRFGPCPSLVREICEMSMPKFIWVSEVIDRELRAEKLPSVVASMAISGAAVGIDLYPDASTEECVVPLPSDVLPLFVQVPGWFKVFDPMRSHVESWRPSLLSAYATGRWSADWRPNYGLDRLAARLKMTDHS